MRILRFAALVVVASAFLEGPPAARAELFRWAFPSNISGLDGMSTGDIPTRNLLRNVYDSLTRFGADMQPEAALAVSWTRQSPELWRFSLRPGVVFHDGTPFTADDVVFSFRRANAAMSDIKPRLATVKDIRKVDALTIDVETIGPSPTLLIDLTYMDVFSQAWAEKNGASEPILASTRGENYATRNANGTGPFRVVSFDVAQGVELVPFDKWWGKVEHNLTRVMFVPITQDATRVAALLSGQIDVALPVPQQDIPRLQASPQHEILLGPEDRVVFFGMDQARDELLYSSVKDRNPFRDARVRQAFYQAIDVKLIRERIMRGAAGTAGTLTSKAAFGWHPHFDERLPFDPAASRKLLEEAGYADGFRVTLDCPTDLYVSGEQICVAVSSMLAQVGVKVEVLAQPRSLFSAKIGKRDTSFYIHSWGSAPDALNLMRFLMHSPAAPLGSWNIGGFSDARVDELIKALGVELEPEKRLAMFREAFDIHRAKTGVIPLHTQALAWGVRKGVSLRQRPDNYLDLRYVRVTSVSR